MKWENSSIDFISLNDVVSTNVETAIINEIESNLREIFNRTDFITILESVSSDANKLSSLRKPDLSIKVQTKNDKKFQLVFEIKTAGQPRYVRMALGQLSEFILKTKYSYGVFASTFISEESRKICLENGIGFIDLGGNWKSKKIFLRKN